MFVGSEIGLTVTNQRLTRSTNEIAFFLPSHNRRGLGLYVCLSIAQLGSCPVAQTTATSRGKHMFQNPLWGFCLALQWYS